MNSELKILAHRQLSEFDRALITATHFGFMPISAPKVTRHDMELTKNCGVYPYYDPVEKAATIRTYIDENFSSLPHPLALIYKKPLQTRPSASVYKEPGYCLHFIGSTSGIAEAALVRAAYSILTEEGHRALSVDLNCVGDRESLGTYERELLNFVRKYGGELSATLREKIREDVFNLFRLEDPEAIELRKLAPSAITYLSSASRTYFKEVLEYLEALKIEFNLVPELVGEKHHTSHAIFVIKNSETSEALAVGYRYSRLGRMFGMRKEIPMASITILPKQHKSARERIYKALPKPKFFLVQLGPEAKIKTLSILELLRSHHIHVYHLIGRDKITIQLTSAEELGVPYLIIIGQKEALSNTATVRNVTSRAQDTIGLDALPDFLKHIRL